MCFVFRGLKKLFFKKKLEKGVFFKNLGDLNVHFQETRLVLVRANLKSELKPV